MWSIAYRLLGGTKRKDRPNGGFYVNETDISPTLDSATGLNPTANQGGLLIIYINEERPCTNDNA